MRVNSGMEIKHLSWTPIASHQRVGNKWNLNLCKISKIYDLNLLFFKGIIKDGVDQDGDM